jgi:hypothetical protein
MKIIYALLFLAAGPVAVFSQSAVSERTEDAKPPFTLTISASPTNPASEDIADQAVNAGSSVMLRIRKTNISDREIVKWPKTGGPFGDSFEVRDPSGNLIELRKSGEVATKSSGEVRIRGTKDMVLQPGESKIDYAQLSDWYDMTKPGTYKVQVSQHVSSDPASDVVKSNTITITVLPAEETPASQP